MKKVIISLVLICATVSFASAQEFKKFKLGLGLGYVIPSDGGGGILLDLEPAYRVNDQIAIGLRLESAAYARSIGSTEADVSASGSYTLNGIYYLSDNKFRPYVGAGFGIYSIASASVNVNTGNASGEFTVDGGSQFGFYPRIGFDLGHFNVNIDYNLISATEGESIDLGDGNTLTTDDITNSYLGFRIGAFIFGGRN